jgi:hypothetical protein
MHLYCMIALGSPRNAARAEDGVSTCLGMPDHSHVVSRLIVDRARSYGEARSQNLLLGSVREAQKRTLRPLMTKPNLSAVIESLIQQRNRIDPDRQRHGDIFVDAHSPAIIEGLNPVRRFC